jgi:hypothetical protein
VTRIRIAESARLTRQVIYRLRAAICAGSGHPESLSNTLASTLELNGNGLAYVVNDNLGDSCQPMS